MGAQWADSLCAPISCAAQALLLTGKHILSRTIAANTHLLLISGGSLELSVRAVHTNDATLGNNTFPESSVSSARISCASFILPFLYISLNNMPLCIKQAGSGLFNEEHFKQHHVIVPSAFSTLTCHMVFDAGKIFCYQ